MSFKQQIVQKGDCRYLLEKGSPVPVEIFMSEQLVKDSEEELWNEVVTIASFPNVTRVAVTPDAHASGNGIPVGVAVETDGVIAACAAGYDISCGMAAVRTNLSVSDITDDKKVRAWIDGVEKRVATGTGRQRAKLQRSFSKNEFMDIIERGAYSITNHNTILHNLERPCLPVDMKKLVNIERAERGNLQLGSLGGGNHFIELDIDQDGNVWSIIHTGSRGYGHGTAEHFFKEGALLQGLTLGNKEKCYFDIKSTIGQQYLNNMNAAANFAIVNRLVIFEAVKEVFGEVFGAEAELFYEISHNLVQYEDGKYVHRKGATRAFPAGHSSLPQKWQKTGHPIIIPGSMGTSSAILFATEKASESIFSINHGCGRVMGRKAAKRTLCDLQQDINKEMQNLGILINTRDVPLDECAHVYKGIDEVLYSVETSGIANVVYKLYPRAVIKGTD